jgi:hypothetical protein
MRNVPQVIELVAVSSLPVSVFAVACNVGSYHHAQGVLTCKDVMLADWTLLVKAAISIKQVTPLIYYTTGSRSQPVTQTRSGRTV